MSVSTIKKTFRLSASDRAVLDAIEDGVDGIEALLTSSNSLLTDIETATDGIETLITSSNALLTTIDIDTSNISNKIDTLAGAVSGAGFNITQLGGAAIPMITTQADDIVNTQDTLAVTSFLQLFDGTTWDRARGDSTDGLLVNLGTNNDVVATQSGTWNITNISGTVSLPTGAATSAKQDTIIGHVDGIETLIGTTNTTLTTIDGRVDGIETLITAGNAILTTIDADTSNISTKIDTLAGAVAGTEFQVDVLTMPTVAVTNAGLTELAAAINSNKLDINLVSSDVAFGGTSAADDAAFTDGTTSGTPVMGVYESTPTTVADNKLGVVGITTNRRLKVSVENEPSVALSATDNAVLDAIAASVAAIDTDTTTLIGHVDGIETLIGTTNTTLTTIDGRVDGIEALLTTISGDTTDIEAAVELIDDTVVVLGTDVYTEATSKGLVIGAVRRDADTTLVGTTNEFGPLQMDINGRLKTEVFSGETLPVSLTSTTVTGTVAVTQSGTWDEVGINDSGNSITVDAPVGTPVFVRLSDGSAAISTLPVSLVSVPSHAVTNAGVFVVQENGAGLSALRSISQAVGGSGFNISQLNGVAVTMGNGAAGTGVQRVTIADDSTGQIIVRGNVAHDAADGAANPVKIGFYGVSSLTQAPVLVSHGDRSDAMSDRDGVQLTRANRPLADFLSQRTTVTDGTAAELATFAGFSGLRNYITAYSIYNYGPTNTFINFRDGTSGVILYTVPAPAGGGANVAMPEPLFRAGLSSPIAYHVGAGVGVSTVYISVTGFRSKI